MLPTGPPGGHVVGRLAQLYPLVQHGVHQDVLAYLVQQVDAGQAARGSLLSDWLHEDHVGWHWEGDDWLFLIN